MIERLIRVECDTCGIVSEPVHCLGELAGWVYEPKRHFCSKRCQDDYEEVRREEEDT